MLKKGETVCIHGNHIRACPTSPDFSVYIKNSTPHEVDNDTCQKIAERVLFDPIYFNDLECFYWMFDFNVWGHWCEVTKIAPGDTCEVNIYTLNSN